MWKEGKGWRDRGGEGKIWKEGKGWREMDKEGSGEEEEGVGE